MKHLNNEKYVNYLKGYEIIIFVRDSNINKKLPKEC